MVTEFVSGNIFVRPVHMAKEGDVVYSHNHPFDHTTIVFRGRVLIRATFLDGNEGSQIAEAPCHFLITAGIWHEIQALEDDTLLWCVYSHRDANGGVVQDAKDAVPHSYNCEWSNRGPWNMRGFPPPFKREDASDRLVIHRHG